MIETVTPKSCHFWLSTDLLYWYCQNVVKETFPDSYIRGKNLAKLSEKALGYNPIDLKALKVGFLCFSNIFLKKASGAFSRFSKSL